MNFTWAMLVTPVKYIIPLSGEVFWSIHYTLGEISWSNYIFCAKYSLPKSLLGHMNLKSGKTLWGRFCKIHSLLGSKNVIILDCNVYKFIDYT